MKTTKSSGAGGRARGTAAAGYLWEGDGVGQGRMFSWTHCFWPRHRERGLL